MEQLPSSRYKEEEMLHCVNCARELTHLDTKVDTLCVIDQNHVIRIPVKNVLSQIYSLKFLNVFESEEENVNEEPHVLCFLCSNKLKCCYETYLDFNHARDSVSLLSKKIQRLEDFVVTSTVEVPQSKSNNNNGLGCSKLDVDPVNITGDSGYGYSGLEPPDDDETNSSTETNTRNNNNNNSKDLSGSDEDQDSFQEDGRNISFEIIQSEDEENLPGTSSQVQVMKSIAVPRSVEKSRCSIKSSRISTSNTRLPSLRNQYTPTKYQQSSSSFSSSNTVIRKPPPKKYIVQFECQICNSIFDSIQELNEHTSIIHAIKSKNTTHQSNTTTATTQIESHGRVLRSSPNKNELLLQQVQISVVNNNSRKSKKSLQTQSRVSYTERECEDSESGSGSDSFLLSPESIQAAVMPTRYNTRARSASNSNSSSPSKQVISSNKTLPCEIRNLNEVQRVEEEGEEFEDNDQDDENDKTFSPKQRGRVASTSTSTSRRSSESGKRRSNRRRILNPNLEVSRYWTQELLYPPRRRGVKIEPIVDIPLPEGKTKPPFPCPYCPLDTQQVLVFQTIDDYETHVKETHLGLKRLSSTDNSEEDEEDICMDNNNGNSDDNTNNEDDNTHQNVPNKTFIAETQNPSTSVSKEQGNGDYNSFEETERNNNNNNNSSNHANTNANNSRKISTVNKKKVVSTKMSQAQIRYTFFNCPPYQCPYCNLTGATLDVIRNHLKCYHLKFDSTCNYCGEIFPTKANLREHIPNCPKCPDPSAAAALLAGKKNKQKDKSVPPGSWICEFCGKDFSIRVYMSKHINRVHGDNKFKCPCCPKDFRTRTYLSRHMDCHVTSRQFVCETCGGTYKSAHHLRLHVRRTHNPEVREKLKMYHKKKDREYKIKKKAMQESTVV